MTVPKLRVLIVDDSTVARKVLSDALAPEADIEVITAPNGRVALAKVAHANPDLVTLDLEMPEMDGLATLRALRSTNRRLPVIMFSSLTVRGAASTLDALACGANDYVTKPSATTGPEQAIAQIRAELLPRIRALCGREPQQPAPAILPLGGLPQGRASTPAIIAIGVSTGGPNALSTVFSTLPPNLPVPIVIVQHMPPIFTRLLADRLTSQCALPVHEAQHGTRLLPFNAYIAPGGFHMTVERGLGGASLALNTHPPENSCRPAVDVLFRSVARVYGSASLGVVLTGMGSDGMRGCEHIRAAGGRVIAQDEESSVVWGMPGFVARAGLADKVLPLREIAQELIRQVTHPRAIAG